MGKVFLIDDKIICFEATHRAHGRDKDLCEAFYRVLFFKASDKVQEYGTPCKMYHLFQQIENCGDSGMSKNKDGKYTVCFRNGSEGWIFLIKTLTEEEMEQYTALLKKKLTDIMSQYPSADYYGGAGISLPGISQIKRVYESAASVYIYIFYLHFLHGSRQILMPEEIKLLNREVCSFDDLDGIKYGRMLLREFLKKGIQEEVDNFLDFCFQEMPEKYIRSLLMRQYICIDMYVSISTFYELSCKIKCDKG